MRHSRFLTIKMFWLLFWACIDALPSAAKAGFRVGMLSALLFASLALGAGYAIAAPPTITSISPNSGSGIGGTVVTITGTNLDNVSAVNIGPLPAVITSNTTTSVTVTTSEFFDGTFDVTVVTPDGSATIPGGYTYLVPVLTFSPASGPLAAGMVGAPYRQPVVASGGLNTSYSVSSGTLPDGLTLNTGTGTISGTPTTPGNYSFTIFVRFNAGAGRPDSGRADYTIAISEPLPIANAVTATVLPNSSNNPIVLDITGGTAESVAVATRPAHGTATASGTAITYTPTAGYSGPDIFNYIATNASGTSAPARVTIIVSASAPSISDISPNSGSAGGAVVTITGTNFDNVSTVTFGGLAATIITNTATAVIVTAPDHGPGAVDVTVTTPAGSVTVTGSFTYWGPLIISPPVGLLPGGMVGAPYSLTITASGASSYYFGISGGVLPGGLALDSSTGVISGTLTTPGTYSFIITVHGSVGGGVTSSGSAIYTVRVADQVPVAGAVSATVVANSAANPIALDITGGTAESLAVATQPAHGTATVSGTTITYTPNAGYSGPDSFTYTATNASGTSSPATVAITVDAAMPSIGTISPNFGTTWGGTAVTITGSDLAGATSITFGGVPAASYTVDSSSQITAVVPAHASGSVDVSVTTAGGTTTLTNSFTYIGAPTITSISPFSGPPGGGTSVIITGSSLDRTTSVTFGGTSASYTVNSSNSITATAPAHAAGAVDISVMTAGGQATAVNGYTYLAASSDATLSNLTLSAGTLDPSFASGTTSYTVLVYSFDSSVTVTPTLSDANATVTVNGSIVSSGSASAPINLAVGDNTVTVVGTAEDGVTTRTYTITITRLPAPPIISSISPNSGSVAGGTSVTITGTNLTAATSVTFGGVPAGIIATSATSVTVITPAHAAGSVDVSVTTPGGTTTWTNSYSYLGFPTVTAISPNSGTSLGGTAVTISGTDLAGANAVTFGGAAAAIISNTANSVIVTTPDYLPRTVDVTVTTAGGSVTATGRYTYAVPALTVSPAAGALPDGMIGTSYNQTITVLGAPLEGIWVVAGVLPDGLTLDPPTGVISGTPTTPGSYSFTVQVIAFIGGGGKKIMDATYDLTVVEQAPVANAVSATVTANSSANVVALDIVGGTATSVAVVTQPGHGTATASGTTITYTPAAGYSGPDWFTYTATNASGTSAEAPVTITVTAPTLVFSPASGALPDGMVGTPYNETVTASQGNAPYSYAVTVGALPAGLSLDPSTGVVSGTPTTVETANFSITATDANGATGTVAYVIAVADRVPVAGAVSTTVAANSSANPITLDITGGTPTSVAVAGAASHGTAIASGTIITYMPTAGYSGPDSFTYTATNASGTSAAATVSITVTSPTLTFSPAAGALPGGMVGAGYSQTVTVSGGTAPYSYAVTSGALPAGLTLSSAGEITGTPTAAENAGFTITATDTYGASNSSAYTLAIAVQAPIANAVSTTVTANSSANSLTLNITGGPAASVAVAGAPSHGATHVSGLDISYTPTTGFSGTDTFTYTATNASGTSAPATVTITVSPPTLIFAPASGVLAAGTVGTPYSQAITVSGGTAPYAFAATGLSNGLTLDAATGAIAGTPTAAGTSSIDVTVTDANGAAGAVTYSLAIGAAPPVAADKNAELLAGASATVDLVAGARGGPFTGAAIITRPSSGTAGISGSGGAYRLTYTAGATAAGTVIVRYALSSASGTSAPATITFTVIARPDPSLDPEVTGLVNAQAQTAQRFATTQIQNFNERLERLHDDGAREAASFGIRLGTAQNSDRNDPLGYVEEDLPDDPIGRVMRMPRLGSRAGSDRAEPPSTPAANTDLAFWAGGFVNFGTAGNKSADTDLAHTLVGVSGGVDYRFTPDFVGGIGLGYGRDRTDIGDNGTTSTGQALSAAIYGSYHPAPLFLDGLVGLSRLDLASTRFVTSIGDATSGNRDGTQVFGSLGAGYEYKQDGLMLSPYGRIQAAFTQLDAFAESGSGLYDLAFAKQSLNMLAGVAGLRGEYAMPMDWGVLATRGRLEYTHDFSGPSNASMGYADLGTTPYDLDPDEETREHVTLGLGLDARLEQGVILSFDYRTSFDFAGDEQDHSFGVRIGGRF